MRYAVITDGVVSNVAEGPSDWAPEDAHVVASDSADIGWKMANGKLVAPPSPPMHISPPEEISRRQFYQQLAVDGEITEDEAAAASATVPEKLAAAVTELPKEQQFPAKMLLLNAAYFERHHPLVDVLGGILKKDDAALDALWTAMAAL